MSFIFDRNLCERLQKQFPEGTRVRLEVMDDEQAPPIGTLGTVQFVDGAATVHVNWDNGSTLGAAYPEDRISVVEE